MHTAKVRRKYDISAEKIWAAFDDFGGIHKFHPLIEKSPTINNKENGLGCERECHFYGGGSLKERITEYKPGKSMKVEIYDTGPFPLKKAFGDIRVYTLGTNKSEVFFSLHFEPKYGPVGWLMAKLMMKLQFTRSLNQLLDGLEKHLETGKIIGKKGVLLDAKAVPV